MVDAMYERNGNVLKDLTDSSGKSNIVCESVSKAKKKSRELQQANGGLGMGFVRVKK